MPGKVTVKEITTSQTWPIRHAVMWPDKPLSFVQLPEDQKGHHYGLFLGNQLISVVSLFHERFETQFRKIATVKAFQRQGLGSRLLQHIFTIPKERGTSIIWCHARTLAQAFYQRLGMYAVGEPFLRHGLEYVRMEKAL